MGIGMGIYWIHGTIHGCSRELSQGAKNKNSLLAACQMQCTLDSQGCGLEGGSIAGENEK